METETIETTDYTARQEGALMALGVPVNMRPSTDRARARRYLLVEQLTSGLLASGAFRTLRSMAEDRSLTDPDWTLVAALDLETGTSYTDDDLRAALLPTYVVVARPMLLADGDTVYVFPVLDGTSVVDVRFTRAEAEARAVEMSAGLDR